MREVPNGQTHFRRGRSIGKALGRRCGASRAGSVEVDPSLQWHGVLRIAELYAFNCNPRFGLIRSPQSQLRIRRLPGLMTQAKANRARETRLSTSPQNRVAEDETVFIPWAGRWIMRDAGRYIAFPCRHHIKNTPLYLPRGVAVPIVEPTDCVHPLMRHND
jgi:hypothetical protein